MIASRLLWAAWALVPVGLISYHYGPGQRDLAEDRAASLFAEARASEAIALEAQSVAYEQHLEAVDARRRAFSSQSLEDEAAAREATRTEGEAYATAAAAWGAAAEQLGAVQSQLDAGIGAADGPATDLRLARARALVRSGDIWTGIEELESLVALEASSGAEGGATAGAQSQRRGDGEPAPTIEQLRGAREELATAYYYGARLLRLSGYPQQEWRVESGKARQNFRYLSELARADGESEAATEDVRRHELNVELVLNLEQASLTEVQGKALPRNSPCQGECKFGKRESMCKGKRPAPPRDKKDGRGAGGAEDIGAGW
jgi:hypothetical protein